MRAETIRHLNKSNVDAQYGLFWNPDDPNHWWSCARDGQHQSSRHDTPWFSKTFDKVFQKRLLLKLNLYWVQGNTQSWTIRSFIRDWTHHVFVDGEPLTIGHVMAGVSQWLALCQDLYVSYINDRCDNIKTKARLFADDITLNPRRGWHSPSTAGPQHLGEIGQEVSDELQCIRVSCSIMQSQRSENIATYYRHQRPLNKVANAIRLGVELIAGLL